MYHTGDYGRLVKGVVLYEGRTDSQVKVRGHRVDLAEIDAALNKLEPVDKTAVLCFKPGEVDQVIQHSDNQYKFQRTSQNPTPIDFILET